MPRQTTTRWRNLDPIQRMRKERRIALLLLNVFLVVTALIQLLGLRLDHGTRELPPPAPSTEFHE